MYKDVKGHGSDIQSSLIRVKARREHRVQVVLKVKALPWTARDVGLSPAQCSSLFLASKITLRETNYLFHNINNLRNVFKTMMVDPSKHMHIVSEMSNAHAHILPKYLDA